MRLRTPIAGVLATTAVLAVPALAHAAPTSGSVLSPGTPCATAAGFSQVASGQTLSQVQQEMGSTGNTSDTSTRGGFTREEVTWRNCSTLLGRAGVLDFGVVLNATPSTPLTVTSKTQLALGTL